ncbi:MAG: hypothetical protein ACI909_003125 [Planctomycetota bacterium]|jgi:hypothetical protein
MDDTLSLIVYILFGAIGMGYFIYGKRQGRIIPLICGSSLMVYPYFFDNPVVLVAVGIVLIGLPYFVRY